MRGTLSFLVAMLVAGGAAAHSSGGGFSLRLEDEHGGTLPAWEHRGETFVQGVFGQRYNLRIHNGTGQRVEAVVTVDGRDVLTGDAGDYVRQRGYIVPPYGSVLVEGFRQSFSDVAAFRFTDPGDSYSARRGTPQNVGVVGVAIFRERAPQPVARPHVAVPPPRPDYRPYDEWGMPRGGAGTFGDDAEKRGSADASEPAAQAPPRTADAPMAGPGVGTGAAEGKSRRHGGSEAWQPTPLPQNNLGTAFGETRYSPVTEVPFVRARPSRPEHLLTARYDDARGLASRGIPVRPDPWQVSPQPFPYSDRRFAPPPP